jgi:acetolactate synthase-1/2/3 large subunit
MPKITGAQAIVEAWKKENVEHIFGIIGGAVLDIYDVLYDADIHSILARHEQCAAHMADGYARVSGLPGVCIATSGPGATNLVTGIANAYMDSSPIIAFTGQVNTYSATSSYMIGRDAFQEADIVGITTPITKYVTQVKRAEDIPKTIRKAFYIATSGRPGPVLVDLPKDVQSKSAEMEFPDSIEIRGYKPRDEPHPIQVKRAVKMLVKASRPMILAGGGVITSGAAHELLKLAELMFIPVATTLMGKGSIAETHPLSLGMVGMHGTAEANKLIPEADVLLTVGSRFSDRTTGRLDGFCPDAKIIQIDIDTAEVGKNLKVDLPIVGDARKALREINKVMIGNTSKKEKSFWFSRIQEIRDQLMSERGGDDRSLEPRNIMKVLRELLPNNAIAATEVGQNQMWAALHFKTLEPRTFISSGGLGCMGFGFPAALGAKVAKPDAPVVDIPGDGSFIMTEQELATSVIEKIPVIVVVLNNSMLGMVAQWQRLFYNRRYASTMLKDSPNFVKLSEAFGAQGIRVGSIDEFSKAIKKALKSDVTTVIDVPISPEENVFPMIPAGKALKDMIFR